MTSCTVVDIEAPVCVVFGVATSEESNGGRGEAALCFRVGVCKATCEWSGFGGSTVDGVSC